MFVTRTRVDCGFDPFCVARLTAALSSEMTGAGGGVMVIDADVTGGRPVLEKVSVRSPGVPEIESPTNVATPPTAVTEVVPPRVPPPDAIATVTEAVEVVTTFPAASRISMTGCAVSGLPITPPVGCALMASWVAKPGVTLTASDACAVSAVAVIVVLPAFIPVIVPPETVAIVGSALDQEIVVDSVRPSFVKAVPVTAAVVPETTVSGPAGDSLTVAGLLSTGGVGVLSFPPHAFAMRSAPRHVRCRQCMVPVFYVSGLWLDRWTRGPVSRMTRATGALPNA